MLESSVPSRFWVEALSTIVYLINHLPSPTLHLDSPCFHLFGVPPDYNFLHVFVASILFTYLPLNVTSLLLKLFNVLFLAIITLIKGLCYDVDTSKIKFSFCLILIMFLPLFRFVLLMIYLVLLLVFSQVLCINDVAHCLFLQLNHHLILSCMSPTSLIRFLGLKIGMNFLLLLFRTITLGTLSLVLLELSLLSANGYTPSSYVLMALLKDIKLVWWHSKIGRSMGLIMRKHSLPWPNDYCSHCYGHCCFERMVALPDGCEECVFTW